MIRLRDVSFGFPAAAPRDFLGPVSLTIEDGEWVAVAGGNGSGKTTLCRLMAGLYRSTSGTVEVNGSDPARPQNGGLPPVAFPAHASGDARIVPAIGVAFQNPDSQFVTSSVEREILFGMENVGLEAGEMDSRSAAAARVFRLDRYLDRNPHTLSGGEKQRLLLACLWAMGPRHLILDEPFSFLDAAGRISFLEVLRGSFRSEGKTIVWSTIARDEVSLADRVIYLHKGRILFDGSPRHLAASLASDMLDDSLVRRDPENASSDGKLSDARTAGEAPKAFDGARSARETSGGSHPLIEIHDASFSPGGEEFILDVPFFSVAPGESIGICGPSGCGKTTFLLGCAGLLQPRAGEITMFGARVSSKRDFPAGCIAYLFQTPEEGFFAPTVREEIALAYKSVVRGSGGEAAVSRALRDVGLEPERFLERSPFHLSQGEKRLIALASVLVLEARVFMLDEPTIFLDGAACRKLRAALERIRSQGASIVVASHDTAFIKSFAERIVSLEGGKLA